MPRKRIQIPQSTALLASGPPFEPKNEAGVAMIFGQFADALGFKIISAQVPYPDCTAVYRGETLRIELEYVSKHFEAHGHDPRKCDLVVCWKHVWPKMHATSKYRDLPVLELRKQFGRGWGVWIQGLAAEYAVQLPKGNRYSDGLFSVAASAGADDLVLIYRPQPDGVIQDIMRVASPVEWTKAYWKPGYDWMAGYQRVATLEKPLELKDIAESLGKPRKTIGRSLQGRPQVTRQWGPLRRRILQRNPDLHDVLDRYGPSRAAGR